MTHVFDRPQYLTQRTMRAAFMAALSCSMFLFAACEANRPAGQGDLNNISGPQGLNATLTTAAPVDLRSASTFAVLGGSTVTNAGASLITGNAGVSVGTELTGFDLSANTIVYGPPGGTVTPGLGIVIGTIYAGGPVAAQAHNDAVLAYDYLVAQVPDSIFAGVTQLDGMTFTPGVYRFAPSANLQVNGTVVLDCQGDNDAQFIFQMGSTLVTMTGSQVVAINNDNTSCSGANVYWAVGSSATIDGAQFVGTVIANTTITMTSGANVSGRMLALNGAVTMITDSIAVCGGSGGGTVPPTKPCRDFVTGGGWIKANSDAAGHKKFKNDKATFGVSGGIKNGQFWGQLSYNDHERNGVKVKSTSVTAYIVLDAVTRQIEGTAKVNGRGSFTYKVIVVDNGEPGRNDVFSLELSNGYSVSGTLKGGNIQLRRKCGESRRNDHHENYDDKDERDGHNNCNDRD